MEYIDVHAHLDMDRFEDDVDEVIARAKGLNCFIISAGVNPIANRKILEFSKKYDNVFCSFGIYPIDGIINEFPDLEDDGPRKILPFSVDKELEWIREHKENCVLIGEIGLDFKVIEVIVPKDVPNSKMESVKLDMFEKIKVAQIKNFEKIIEFSKVIEKPILIHTRGAELECIELLEKHEAKNVIMHCFQGKKKYIQRIVENEWFLTVPAVITRLEHFKMLVEMTPLDKLLTETDSPFLSPIVGERNEPKNVIITVKEIAKIKGIDEEIVKKQLVKNAKKILNLN